jgi:hypothetical protein
VADLVHARLSIPIPDDVDQDVETEFIPKTFDSGVPSEEDDPEVMHAPEEAVQGSVRRHAFN